MEPSRRSQQPSPQHPPTTKNQNTTTRQKPALRVIARAAARNNYFTQHQHAEKKPALILSFITFPLSLPLLRLCRITNTPSPATTHPPVVFSLLFIIIKHTLARASFPASKNKTKHTHAQKKRGGEQKQQCPRGEDRGRWIVGISLVRSPRWSCNTSIIRHPSSTKEREKKHQKKGVGVKN